MNNPPRGLRAPVPAPPLRCGLPHVLPADPCSLLGRGAKTQGAVSSPPAWPWDAAGGTARTPGTQPAAQPAALGGNMAKQEPAAPGKGRQGRGRTPARRGAAACRSASGRPATCPQAHAPAALRARRCVRPTGSRVPGLHLPQRPSGCALRRLTSPSAARPQAHAPGPCLTAPAPPSGNIPRPGARFGDSAGERQPAGARQAASLPATPRLT